MITFFVLGIIDRVLLKSLNWSKIFSDFLFIRVTISSESDVDKSFINEEIPRTESFSSSHFWESLFFSIERFDEFCIEQKLMLEEIELLHFYQIIKA